MIDLSDKEIVHMKKDGVEYIQFRKLLQYPEIQHCYTIKNGLDFKIVEDGESLQENYKKICKSLELNSKNIVKPHQTHTDRVERVDYVQEYDEVDGVITNKPDITLLTTSADCTSLLLFDPVKKVIGDIHSGWRGTLSKIGQKAVQKMIDEYQSNPKDIICCICPHIRKCHFEVEEDVANMFRREFEYTGRLNEIIEEGRSINEVQKYYIDTTLINQLLLKEIGLKDENIIDSGICTVCNSDQFHSYRTDKEDSGRNAAIITLKSK